MTEHFYQKRALLPYQQKQYEAMVAASAEHGEEIDALRQDSAVMNAVSSIAFVTLAESGTIDDVTASEHANVFSSWEPDVDYVVGNLRQYNDALYKCVQSHRSQSAWAPDKAVSLWAKAGDPREEWPAWSQPIGAHDAYMKGDKVTYEGEHWISTADNNVWKPGVYGWEKAE